MKLSGVIEESRHASPAVAPQALAWHQGKVWLGSRDLRRIYSIEPAAWRVVEEMEAPGIPWAAVAVNGELCFTLGLDPDDDRYVYRFLPGEGFSEAGRVVCPDFTGSYLSHDGKHLYLSQWYKHRVLRLGESGEILGEIQIGAEISGHTFANGKIYVLRGTEQNGESWTIAQFDPREEQPVVHDLATIPFACRSLAFDGECFWSNHRAANETVRFRLPEK